MSDLGIVLKHAKCLNVGMCIDRGTTEFLSSWGKSVDKSMS